MAEKENLAAGMQSEGSLTEALGKLTGDKDTEARGAARMRRGETDAASSDGITTNRDADKTIVLHDEHLLVSRRRIERDTVRVSTVTTRTQQTVNEALRHTRVEINRVPIGRVVDRVPDIREEDGVTIVPVVNEEIVISKRLVLAEEVHFRRVVVDDVHRETVVLQTQDAIVSRIPSAASASATPEHTSSVQEEKQ